MKNNTFKPMFVDALPVLMVVITAIVFLIILHDAKDAFIENHRAEKLLRSKAEVTLICKDGSCYDPKTNKDLGLDPEMPVQLSSPVAMVKGE